MTISTIDKILAQHARSSRAEWHAAPLPATLTPKGTGQLHNQLRQQLHLQHPKASLYLANLHKVVLALILKNWLPPDVTPFCLQQLCCATQKAQRTLAYQLWLLLLLAPLEALRRHSSTVGKFVERVCVVRRWVGTSTSSTSKRLCLTTPPHYPGTPGMSASELPHPCAVGSFPGHKSEQTPCVHHFPCHAQWIWPSCN
jgi:hypothetical protein